MKGQKGRGPSPIPRKFIFSRQEHIRPVCPVCRARAPHPEAEDFVGIEWAQLFGHRCPHGEPCPAFSSVKGLAVVCPLCINERIKNRVGKTTPKPERP